jgi:hypothetical protein
MPDQKDKTPSMKRFGIDARTGELILGRYRLSLPKSRTLRIMIGVVLILGGLLSLLPVFGLWMLPLGFLVLSNELPMVRRWRRRLILWWERRKTR